MTDDLDKIKLNIDLIKEKWRRDIYVKWVQEMNTRRLAGECPKCGVREWYSIGTKFHQKLQCEKCGMIITYRDIVKGDKWWDFITLFARKEIKRIERAKRQSQSVRTYEKDKI